MKQAIALLALLLPGLFGTAAPAQEGKKKYKALYVTQSKGFRHGSVTRKDGGLAPSEAAVTEIARESGLFEVECTQDASVLTPEKLKELDIVLFYTTGALPISPENFEAFLSWLRAGKAFVGIHSATDTFHNYKPYYELINGVFDGHPWGAGETVTLRVHDAEHAAVKSWGPELVIKDEIYQYRLYDPKAVRVLASLDMAGCKTKRPYHVPVVWVRQVGKGRLFYTNLGHNEGTWQDARFRTHLLAGIRWALGLEAGSAEPNPEVQALEGVRSFAAVAAVELGRNGEELAAAAERRAKDAAWLERMAAELGAFRKLDPKKDADRRRAEMERLLGELEKRKS